MLLKRYKYIFFIKIFFLLVSLWLFLVWFFSYKQKDNINNKNIVFIVDTSHSMNVEDIQGKYWIAMTRLSLTKEFIKNKIDLYPDYKIWLIIFSKNANYFIPPTLDKKTLKTYIQNLNTFSIPLWWTNIYQWLETFFKNTDGWIWVLISDFWNSQDFDLQKDWIQDLIDNLWDKDITVIWIWSQQWWEVRYPTWEPISDWWATIDFREDDFGKFIANQLWTQYHILQTYDEFDNINIMNDNKKFKVITDKKNLSELIASLLAIFSI